ncbi:MAG: hypothetical protein OXD31_02635 [Chloroflexi bacterium]|nr:hypothetical protein [Chloroflexota bacterium]
MTTLNTTDDLLRAARENQEFREAFRRELLTEELLSIPRRFDRHAEFTNNRVDALIESVATLTTSVTALTEEIATLTKNTNERFDRVGNDIGELKGIRLESKLYNRGIALMATHLRMHEGRIVRVAEADDNSREFNRVILSALKGGRITQDQYTRILDTDMVVAGTETESGNPIYAVIEASYSLSGDDISKVCATTTLVRRLFPETVVKPVLYFVTPNARLEGEAADQEVTLVRTTGIR